MNQRLFLVGLVLISHGRLPAYSHPDPLENIRIYTYILSVSPENYYSYLNRGICYRMVGNFEEALADFNRAEHHGITGKYLWLNRAMTYIPLKQLEKALEDLTRIVQADAKDANAWFYRGEILFRMGRYDESIADYTRSLEAEEMAPTYYARADTYRVMGEYEKALADFSRAVDMRPYTMGYLIGRAKLLGEMGRYDEARADFDKAARKQPERYQIYVERAILSASQGLDASRTTDLKLALKYIEDEIFFRPKDPQVIADRARVYELLDLPEKALSDLDQAVELADYYDPRYLRLRAEFHQRRGDTHKSRQDLENALALESIPIPTATPLPGPTLSLEELQLQPTPNLLPGLAK